VTAAVIVAAAAVAFLIGFVAGKDYTQFREDQRG
jgi:hypothetical protein